MQPRRAAYLLPSVIAAALSGLAPFLAPSVTRASGGASLQSTVTPTPTAASPTSTDTPLPPGASLVELMRKAMVAKRTVRMGEVAQSTWRGHSALSWTWMDLDLQANAMREVDTI